MFMVNGQIYKELNKFQLFLLCKLCKECILNTRSACERVLFDSKLTRDSMELLYAECAC
jgi:hypothetical protein